MLKFIVSTFRKSIKDLVARAARKARQLVAGMGFKAGIVVSTSRKHKAMSATQLELSSEINKKRLDAAIANFSRLTLFENDQQGDFPASKNPLLNSHQQIDIIRALEYGQNKVTKFHRSRFTKRPAGFCRNKSTCPNLILAFGKRNLLG